MLQLQGKLDQAGAQGLGERLSEAEADCERLQRRRDELDRRAQALDLLLRLLSDKRAAATSGCRRRWRAGCVITLGCCSPKRRCAWTMPCCPPPCSAPAAGRAGQPEFRHPRAAGHPGALRLRRPVAGGGASGAAGAGRCTGSRRRGPPRLHEAGAVRCRDTPPDPDVHLPWRGLARPGRGAAAHRRRVGWAYDADELRGRMMWTNDADARLRAVFRAANGGLAQVA